MREQEAPFTVISRVITTVCMIIITISMCVISCESGKANDLREELNVSLTEIQK